MSIVLSRLSNKMSTPVQLKANKIWGMLLDSQWRMPTSRVIFSFFSSMPWVDYHWLEQMMQFECVNGKLSPFGRCEEANKVSSNPFCRKQVTRVRRILFNSIQNVSVLEVSNNQFHTANWYSRQVFQISLKVNCVCVDVNISIQLKDEHLRGNGLNHSPKGHCNKSTLHIFVMSILMR
jgi:hypothetical protein